MHPIVTSEEWTEARLALLEEEKALTRARDALAERRRSLPWQRVEKSYIFTATDGPRTLADLFYGKSQLIIQHFMFGPDWDEGCPSCSFWADGYNPMIVHLAHRDAALVTVSNTSIDKINRYKERMGWTFPWVSSLGTDFNRDYRVTFTDEERAAGQAVYNYRPSGFPVSEAPGISVFFRPDDDTIVHTYSTYARGLDMMNAAYHYMDLLPKGRDERAGNMAWLRRHDQYELRV